MCTRCVFAAYLTRSLYIISLVTDVKYIEAIAVLLVVLQALAALPHSGAKLMKWRKKKKPHKQTKIKRLSEEKNGVEGQLRFKLKRYQ